MHLSVLVTSQRNVVVLQDQGLRTVMLQTGGIDNKGRWAVFWCWPAGNDDGSASAIIVRRAFVERESSNAAVRKACDASNPVAENALSKRGIVRTARVTIGSQPLLDRKRRRPAKNDVAPARSTHRRPFPFAVDE